MAGVVDSTSSDHFLDTEIDNSSLKAGGTTGTTTQNDNFTQGEATTDNSNGTLDTSGTVVEHATNYASNTHTDVETGSVQGVNGELFNQAESDYTSSRNGFDAVQTTSEGVFASGAFTTNSLSTGEEISGQPYSASPEVTYGSYSTMTAYPSPNPESPMGLDSGYGSARGNLGDGSQSMGHYGGAVAYLGRETTSSGDLSNGLYSALGSRGANTAHVGKEIQVAPKMVNGITSLHISNGPGSAQWSAAPSQPGYRRPGSPPTHQDVEGGGGVSPLIGMTAPDNLAMDTPSGTSGQGGDIATGASSPTQAPQNQTPQQPSPPPLGSFLFPQMGNYRIGPATAVPRTATVNRLRADGSVSPTVEIGRDGRPIPALGGSDGFATVAKGPVTMVVPVGLDEEVRLAAVGRLAGAAGLVASTAVLAGVPEPGASKVAAGFTLLMAYDQSLAGMRQLISGQPVDSGQNQAIVAGLRQGGLTESESKAIADSVENASVFAGSVAGPVASKLAAKGEAGEAVAASTADDLLSSAPNGVAPAAGRLANCFPAGTPVATEYGPRPIQKVRTEDRVWAFDHDAGEWKLRRVIEVYQNEHDGDLVAVSVVEEVVESTGHHPWWVVRGEGLGSRPQPDHVPNNPEAFRGEGRWVDAIDLRIGDVLLLRSGDQAQITELAVRQARLPVFNIHVEEHHCYAVGHAQILVHNNSGSATVAEVSNWIRSEPPSSLIPEALADYKARLAANDPYVWNNPVEVVNVNGNTYVLNGHHRLTAATDPATRYTGKIPYQLLTEDEAKGYGFDPSTNFGTFGGSGPPGAP